MRTVRTIIVRHDESGITGFSKNQPAVQRGSILRRKLKIICCQQQVLRFDIFNIPRRRAPFHDLLVDQKLETPCYDQQNEKKIEQLPQRSAPLIYRSFLEKILLFRCGLQDLLKAVCAYAF